MCGECVTPSMESEPHCVWRVSHSMCGECAKLCMESESLYRELTTLCMESESLLP